MSNNVVAVKSYSFALSIISLYKFMIVEKKEYILSKQLLRSGTAIGALIREAEHAQSRADFVNKMNISLKEANETLYWLMLLKDSDFISLEYFNTIFPKAEELVKILASTVKTTKLNKNKV